MSGAHNRIPTIAVNSNIMHMRARTRCTSGTCGTSPLFNGLRHDWNMTVG
jgi:hypothetical protein